MGKFTQFKVQLASLTEGHHEQDFAIDSEFFKNMENTDVHAADVKVHMDLEKRGDAYDCAFHCTGKLQVPCDRCLEPLDIDVDTVYHIIVKYGDEYDDASDDILIIPQQNTSLNVAYMLYDTLLLTIPIRHVHPAGKCNRAMAEVLNRHSRTGDPETDDAMDGVDDSDTDSESED